MNKTYNFNTAFREQKNAFKDSRPILAEDALDDALGLGNIAASNDAVDGVEPPAASGTTSVASDITDTVATPPALDGGAQGEVEVDITTLVNKQEATLAAITDLLSKFNSITTTVGELASGTTTQLADLGQHIENSENAVQQEIEKRMPTPVEKMKLQSVHYPFVVNLNDYWRATTEDKYKYQILNPQKPEFSAAQDSETAEDGETDTATYKLYLSDIMKDYDPSLISKTF